MIIAVPVAVLVALFLTQYAPARLAAPFGYLVDLLAAVPSIVYGLWGFYVFRSYVEPLQDWMAKTLAGPACSAARSLSAPSSWPRSCWPS